MGCSLKQCQDVRETTQYLKSDASFVKSKIIHSPSKPQGISEMPSNRIESEEDDFDFDLSDQRSGLIKPIKIENLQEIQSLRERQRQHQFNDLIIQQKKEILQQQKLLLEKSKKKQKKHATYCSSPRKSSRHESHKSQKKVNFAEVTNSRNVRKSRRNENFTQIIQPKYKMNGVYGSQEFSQSLYHKSPTGILKKQQRSLSANQSEGSFCSFRKKRVHFSVLLKR